MALNLDLSPLARTVEALAGSTTPTQWVLQIAVAAIGLVASWAVCRFACGHVRVSPKWQFGKGAFERVLTPLLAFLLVWIGKGILGQYQPVDFLEIVLTLILTVVAVRVASYVIGHVLPEGAFQRAVVRLLHWTAWIVAALYVAGLLPEVAAVLESHGLTIRKHHISLLDVIKGAVALFLTITLALYISRITEGRVLAADSIEMTTRVVIAKIVRISMLFFAIFIALPMAGIDVTTLSVFTGALGVGLGFGLQKITSNYVSGFIVLLDRSLRIGDVVTVDGRRGEVTAIESRYTVIKGADGVESIIPNEKLVTDTVSHHTYSNPKVSLVMGVTVSYESDVQRACEILVGLAKESPRVIAEPPSVARVKQFTEHGVDLELTVWIQDPAVGEGDLKSELFKAVLRAYREAGISIPYPRREIRMIATAEMAEKPTAPMA